MNPIIVTGATGGIGQAITEALYRHGEPMIIAACRRPEAMRQVITRLKNAYPYSPTQIIPLRLDLADSRSVIAAADEIASRGVHPRALINNAGTMPLRATMPTADGYETTLQVNCLATIAFTELILPLMDNGGVVIFTTSITRMLPQHRTDFVELAIAADNPIKRFVNYGRSKQLLVHYAASLAERLIPRGIHVHCADPGIVDSGIISLGWPVIDQLADILFRPLIATPAQGAAAALRALSSTSITPAIFTTDSTKAISWQFKPGHSRIVDRLRLCATDLVRR